MLRGATAAGILDGWNAYGPLESRLYLINPYPARTRTYRADAAVEYCRMLAEACVEPVYRASEPWVIP